MRRKNSNLADDVIGLAALLPWWAAVALALASYLWLHSVAIKPIGTLTQPGHAGSLAISAIGQSLAAIGQFVLPLCFLLGAGISAYKRRMAGRLHADAANRVDGMSQMSWREFEVMVGEFFRRKGFSVTVNGGGGPDGGIDVLLQKGSDSYLVQCKQWRARRVGVQTVRELYGVMASRRVAGGFVVTSGDFTDEARNFAQGSEIELIDGKALYSGVRAQADSTRATQHTTMPQTPAAQSVPICPVCHSPMVVRQNRNGVAPGKAFWGCSRFAQTKCRGTREIGGIGVKH